jgi:lipopolysaccharide heptosyltransferase II
MARLPRQRLRLTLLRTFARFTHSSNAKQTSPDADKAQSLRVCRILIIRPDHLGDLLFITPALRVLRQRYADAHITALVGPWGVPILSTNPQVDDVMALPFPGFSKQPKPHLWQPYGLLRLWARQLRGRYDLAFILRFDHWWGALLAYMAGVPQRVGYAVPEVTPFLSHALPYVAGLHEVEQNLRLVEWDLPDGRTSGTSPTLSFPTHCPLEFHVPAQAMAWVKDLLGNTQPIAVHPGAGAAIKLWRAEGWAAVADALANETGSQILLTGSKAERPLCAAIAAQMETEPWVIAGETTLDQLAAILSQCRLVLGPDSGPLHLATATSTPTVHLYGPVDAATFGPWGPPERHRALISDWPCIPCNRLDYGPKELADHPCVREIGVKRVLIAARKALSV